MALPNAEERLTKIEILVDDPDDQLIRLLNYISILSAPGHSFDVVVDPDSDDEKSFGMDGDGRFYIKYLKKNGIKVKSKDGEIVENYLRDLQC
jgi:hypothetical protein